MLRFFRLCFEFEKSACPIFFWHFVLKFQIKLRKRKVMKQKAKCLNSKIEKYSINNYLKNKKLMKRSKIATLKFMPDANLFFKR